MSAAKDNFIRAAKARNWYEAFWNLNGLNMYEMLRALDELQPALLDELLGKSTDFWPDFNMERIAFAATVVKRKAIPTDIRGDLEKTGQVQDARNFIATHKKAKGETPAPPSRAGQLFPTADQAAIAALDDILPTSVANNWEYAGRIGQNTGGQFFFIKPSTLKLDGKSDPGPRIADNVGAYHTHAGGFFDSDEEFSPDDKFKAIGLKELSYIGTPRGRVLRFTPPDLLSPEDQKTFPGGRVDLLRTATVLVVASPVK